MRAQHRKTFQQITNEEAPRNAEKLEAKARTASWLAKIAPEHSGKLYARKHAALRQLFGISSHSPIIRDAWTTHHDFLLSVRLRRTNALLHVPFSKLNADTQRLHGSWITRRARGRRWQTSSARSRRVIRTWPARGER